MQAIFLITIYISATKVTYYLIDVFIKSLYLRYESYTRLKLCMGFLMSGCCY